MESPPIRRVHVASKLLIDSSTCVEEGGLLVGDSGRIEQVLAGEGACRRAAESSGVGLEHHEGWLTPGFVCAHSHLDLGALSERVPSGEEFPDWIASLLRERTRLSEEEFRAGQEASASELLASGTTAVGDIDALGLPHVSAGPRAVRYRELLDLGGDPERQREVREILAGLAEVNPTPGARLGLSPHAPYTSSVEWMREIAARDDLPVAIHWAETVAERDWLERGEGPFRALLGGAAGDPGPSGLDRIEAAGLLRSSTALIHANDPRPEEIDRVARAGATIVHCPGAHRFFDRERFPIGQWSNAGVPVALGTDSAAGNDSLSMLRELRLLRESFPEREGPECFEMATVCGARALGLQGLAGTLARGAYADFCLWPESAGAGLQDFLEALTRGGVEAPRGLWIHGKSRSLPA